MLVYYVVGTLSMRKFPLCKGMGKRAEPQDDTFPIIDRKKSVKFKENSFILIMKYVIV